MLKIIQIAESLAKAKRLSYETEQVIKLKVDEFMASPEIVELNKVAEDARVDYERLRDEMLKEMQKQKQKTLKTEDGTKIVRTSLTKVDWVDEPALITYLEKENPVCVRKSLDKTSARKYILEEIALGKEIAGVVISEEEGLSVTVPKND